MVNFKLSEDIQEFLKRPTTSDFLFEARQFVQLLELDEIDKAEFIKTAHARLIGLYAAGHRLEAIPLKYSSAEDDFGDQKISTDKIAGLISRFEHEAYYWKIFDPAYTEVNGEALQGWTISDKEPIQGWLVDDFLDIYKDLKEELNKIDTIGTDEAIEDALWQLKFSFNNHWGNHCVDAIRYLHYWYYEGKSAF